MRHAPEVEALLPSLLACGGPGSNNTVAYVKPVQSEVSGLAGLVSLTFVTKLLDL